MYKQKIKRNIGTLLNTFPTQKRIAYHKNRIFFSGKHIYDIKLYSSGILVKKDKTPLMYVPYSLKDISSLIINLSKHENIHRNFLLNTMQYLIQRKKHINSIKNKEDI